MGDLTKQAQLLKKCVKLAVYIRSGREFVSILTMQPNNVLEKGSSSRLIISVMESEDASSEITLPMTAQSVRYVSKKERNSADGGGSVVP